ncbi:uncharacterized protein J3R85_014552 [Psidium guajava]|nr:uncharacterized protein J3R85_014552 [Psidium guajava]
MVKKEKRPRHTETNSTCIKRQKENVLEDSHCVPGPNTKLPSHEQLPSLHNNDLAAIAMSCFLSIDTNESGFGVVVSDCQASEPIGFFCRFPPGTSYCASLILLFSQAGLFTDDELQFHSKSSSRESSRDPPPPGFLSPFCRIER